ncbi:hypothetical protein [Tritonibacter horizontis]|uniref:Tat pathway signal sequence domain protein n=1 Tax=Tritonibacter horizontis TaxID=1768241 RepID=A0A132BV90_9RHOB|nr:hypothetical protein [Tritonibacter horizontis]KUP91962.1 hypothetical protein TRIHO_31450 [Tritonibacter horizontis]
MKYTSQVHLLAPIACVLTFLGGMDAVGAEDTPPPLGVEIELNALADQGGACRLSFLAQNTHDMDIEEAVFETVLFDQSGGVMMLTLFDFQALPTGRPRVRQFDLADVQCAAVGRVLINGASRCRSGGQDSQICTEALGLSSRTKVELLG